MKDGGVGTFKPAIELEELVLAEPTGGLELGLGRDDRKQLRSRPRSVRRRLLLTDSLAIGRLSAHVTPRFCEDGRRHCAIDDLA
jgi:hypothetical protein